MMRRAWLAIAGVAVTCLAGVGTAAGAQQSSSSAADEAGRLRRPPAMDHPQTVLISPTATTLRLDPQRDYIVRIQDGAVLTRGVVIVGGHNVIVRPGSLRYAPPVGATSVWSTRAAYFKGQTGTLYVSGLDVVGPLNEGIDLDERAPGATVVLESINIAEVRGSADGHHADLLQTWAGPSRLLVEQFTGRSSYQGFFLEPNQKWTQGPRPRMFWLNNVDIDTSEGTYALWTEGGGAFPIYVRNTHVRFNHARPQRSAWLWPKPSTGDTTWSAVTGS